MADNYIEKRMEDLRNGKIKVNGGVPGIKPDGKRVIAVGGTSGTAREKVLDCRRNGWRVAVMDSDEGAGRMMAYEHGVRFHRTNLSDDNSIIKETENLLNAWRGADIIIGDEKTCVLIRQVIDAWRKSLPVPDKSVVQIVIL